VEARAAGSTRRNGSAEARWQGSVATTCVPRQRRGALLDPRDSRAPRAVRATRPTSTLQHEPLITGRRRDRGTVPTFPCFEALEESIQQAAPRRSRGNLRPGHRTQGGRSPPTSGYSRASQRSATATDPASGRRGDHRVRPHRARGSRARSRHPAPDLHLREGSLVVVRGDRCCASRRQGL